jgi:Ca-activated chloride channel family protein
LLLLLLVANVHGQSHYIRGEVKDENGNALRNVTLLQVRTGYAFTTGNTGTFGIISNQSTDSFSVKLPGFGEVRCLLNAAIFNTIRLKALPSSAGARRRDKLSSITKGLGREEQRRWFAGQETYENLLENRFISAARYPNTGFSPNVDKASYSNIRRFIHTGSIVPPDAVRIEEMLNYFNLGHIDPPPGELFAVKPSLGPCPWNSQNRLLYVGLSARRMNLDTLPPSHLVFLIDVSASMDMPNRLPLLQSAFRMLVSNLRDKDSVSIVVYGGATGVMLPTTSGGEKDKINQVIDELVPGGSTPGESGIQLAYQVAKTHFIEKGNNRVILATDGDFNVGVKTEAELDELISSHRESGIYLTCLGVGMGNYKDSKIQMLARKGNGNFAYLDNFQEAEKILMTEFTQTLYAIADDVYMSVQFNDKKVREYRLIGFDNRMTAVCDTFAIVEGGEVGSGHSMVAVFEITPVEQAGDMNGLAKFVLDYRPSGGTAAVRKEWTDCCTYDPAHLAPADRFAAGVVMFGSFLRGSMYTRNLKWDEVVTYAEKNTDVNDPSQRAFLSLVQQAKTIYAKQKRKKGR